MGDSPRPTLLIRFEGFRADCQSGELFKNGQKLKLSGQPFEVLAMLLQRPGQLVTREELRKKLWPEDTFVDFDHSLNTAINKIREALGDSAENPHFVETLPRRGYRFIAPVESVAPVSSPAGTGAALYERRAAVGTPPLQPTPGGSPPSTPTGITRRAVAAVVQGVEEEHRARVRWERWAVTAIATTALALGVAGWLWFRSSRPTPPEAMLKVAPLTSYPGSEESPSFSPDGTQVAFSWNGEKQDNYDIYVKVIGAEPPLRLTTNPAKEYSPAWSPDGRWIAFCRDLPGSKYAVVLTSPLPGPERILTETFRDLAGFGVEAPYLAWSPDSRWLVYAGYETPSRQPSSLYACSLETGEKRRLTFPPAEGGLGDGSLAFSPNGRSLAFCRWRSWHNSDLYLLEVSSDLQPLAEPKHLTTGNWLAFGPTWTKDGHGLIFSAASGRVTSLWRVAVSGSSPPQKLSSVGEYGVYPVLSRQGDRLAFTRRQYDPNIYRVEIPSQERKPTPPAKFISSTRLDANAAYSPDGRKIAFGSDRSGTSEVWISNADGSNPMQVTSLGGPEIMATPSWSPDSTRLALAISTEGRPQIYVISANGGPLRRVTSDPTGASNPYWSRAGRWIYFDSAGHGILQIRPEGGMPAQVADTTAGWCPMESPDGKFVYTVASAGEVWDIKRIPSQGGEAKTVVRIGSPTPVFAVFEDGIYYVPDFDPNAVHFWNAPTGRSQRIVSIEGPAYSSLDVSPDRRWILYVRRDEVGSDLMLVENFH